jgi:hypothetical protein
VGKRLTISEKEYLVNRIREIAEPKIQELEMKLRAERDLLSREALKELGVAKLVVHIIHGISELNKKLDQYENATGYSLGEATCYTREYIGRPGDRIGSWVDGIWSYPAPKLDTVIDKLAADRPASLKKREFENEVKGMVDRVMTAGYPDEVVSILAEVKQMVEVF